MFVNEDMEQSKEVQLAYEIAAALNDLHSIDWHISVTNRLPERLLRDTLAVVLAADGIRSRARYYNYLIKRHG